MLGSASSLALIADNVAAAKESLPTQRQNALIQSWIDNRRRAFESQQRLQINSALNHLNAYRTENQFLWPEMRQGCLAMYCNQPAPQPGRLLRDGSIDIQSTN